jgi:hypothetical protein
MQLSKKKVVIGTLILIVILSGIFLITRFNPEEVKIFPPCIFHSLTGLYCPGCGMTRAMHTLLNGNFIKAFWYNPLFFTFLPLFIYMGAVQLKALIRTGKTKVIKLPYQLIILIVTMVFLFWILRNIPYYPFIYLAP